MKTLAKSVLVMLAAGLNADPCLAGNYAPFPDTSPGAVYYWKTYKVDLDGKRTLRGFYTNVIQGKTLLGDHEFIVVKRANPEKQPLEDIVYRADDQLFGVLLGPGEESLLVQWKGTPSVGQSWSRGPVQVVIRQREAVEAEGAFYQDCFVIDQLKEGKLVNRSYFDREQGWIESVLYRDGKETAIAFRVPKEGDR